MELLLIIKMFVVDMEFVSILYLIQHQQEMVIINLKVNVNVTEDGMEVDVVIKLHLLLVSVIQEGILKFVLVMEDVEMMIFVFAKKVGRV